MSSWHNSGCKVGPNDLVKIRLVRATTSATGERSLEYKCEECGATHVIMAGRREQAEAAAQVHRDIYGDHAVTVTEVVW